MKYVVIQEVTASDSTVWDAPAARFGNVISVVGTSPLRRNELSVRLKKFLPGQLIVVSEMFREYGGLRRAVPVDGSVKYREFYGIAEAARFASALAGGRANYNEDDVIRAIIWDTKAHRFQAEAHPDLLAAKHSVPIYTPVFWPCEILVVECETGREVGAPYRKPSKWSIRYIYSSDIESATSAAEFIAYVGKWRVRPVIDREQC